MTDSSAERAGWASRSHQYVFRRINASIEVVAAVRTPEPYPIPLLCRRIKPRNPAPAASQRGVRGIDAHHRHTGTFRLVCQNLRELSPRLLEHSPVGSRFNCHALTRVLKSTASAPGQGYDRQILDCEKVVLIYKLSCYAMQLVAIADSFSR